MKHRHSLWQRFLRSLLAIVLSTQFWGIAPLLLLAACMSPEVPESVHASNPKAYRSSICVLPPSMPTGTKVFATDANRSVFVSDRDEDAFKKFLPQADAVFEYDVFARPSSALLLGTKLGLSCPERFEVLRPEDDVGDNESRWVTVVRIPTDTHRQLSSLVEEQCYASSTEKTSDKHLVGQQILPKRGFFLGHANEDFQKRVRLILGLQRTPEPTPSGPPGVVQQLRKTHTGQEIVGLGRGITKAVIPGGTIVVDLGRQAHWLEPGTRTERISEACAELGVGVGQIVLGCGGMGVGGALTGTGGGAPAGALVFVGSLGLTMAGVANCGNAVRHLTIELWRSDEGDAMPSTSPPSEQTTPKTPAEPAKMEPYNKGAGHHVPAKKAFEGAPGYDPKKALAVPKAELEKLGIDHDEITVAQRLGYIDFARKGKPLTWEAIAKIETDALIKAQMNVEMAEATVAKAIQALKDAGIAAPVRIPWGK